MKKIFLCLVVFGMLSGCVSYSYLDPYSTTLITDPSARLVSGGNKDDYQDDTYEIFEITEDQIRCRGSRQPVVTYDRQLVYVQLDVDLVAGDQVVIKDFRLPSGETAHAFYRQAVNPP